MTSRVMILFRRSLAEENEFFIASKYFEVVENRVKLKPGSLVVCRYSALPYYKELEEDILSLYGSMLTTYKQHKYIANFEYYEDVKEFTPKTYFTLEEINTNGPFVVKGRTNSRKAKWFSKMFANTKREAIELAVDLMDDPLLQDQGIIVREYVPLQTFEIGINEARFVNEWRLFFFKEELLAYGFYWVQMDPDKVPSDIEKEGLDLAKRIAKIISKNVSFFAVDVAKTESGKWILIEINDGQMSGLSYTDPDNLYLALASNLG